jgi:hypothetical protein
MSTPFMVYSSAKTNKPALGGFYFALNATLAWWHWAIAVLLAAS